MRVCRNTGDRVLHMLARRSGYSDHIKEVMQVLLDARLSAGEAIRKAAKAADQRNQRGQTPLMLACEHGNINCLRELLAAGADPWLGDAAVRRTCMHYAAGKACMGRIHMQRHWLQLLQGAHTARKGKTLFGSQLGGGVIAHQ